MSARRAWNWVRRGVNCFHILFRYFCHNILSCYFRSTSFYQIVSVMPPRANQKLQKRGINNVASIQKIKFNPAPTRKKSENLYCPVP